MWQYQWNGTGGAWTNWGTTNPYVWASGNCNNTLYVRGVTTNGPCTMYSNVVSTPVYCAPSAGTYNNAGPVDFCDHTGTIPQISVSGTSGSIAWQWGTAGGAWNNWTAGANAGTCCFPVNPGTTGADRIRLIATNGSCTATGTTVILRNMNSPTATSLTASPTNPCSNGTVTLTATFPFANNSTTNVISNYSSVQFFSGSCGGTLLGTVAHVNGVATLNVTPTVNTTYYARSTSTCETSACVQVTVNIETTAPAVTSPGNQTLFNSPANSCLGSVILSDPGVTDACGGTLNGTENLLPASGLVLWTRADAGVQLDDLNRVEMWKDLSGAGNHITQPTEGNRPVVATNAINGLPVIRFNTTQFMTTATGFTNPYSIFTVSKMNNGTDRRLISSANQNWLLGTWGGFQNVMYAEGWLTASSGPTPDNLPHMYSATGTGALTTFYDFGNVIASNASGVFAPNRLQLNSYGGGLGESSDGDVAEVIIYNRVLTAAEREKVEGYLAYKYNLQAPVASMRAAQSFAVGANTANYQGVDAAGNIGSTTSTVTVSSYPGPTVTPSVTTLCAGGTATMTLTGMAPSGQALNCLTNGYLAVPNVPLSADWTVESWFEILGGGVVLPTGSWNTLLRGPSGHHQIIVQRSNWELGTYMGGFFGSGFKVNTLSTGWHHMAAVGTGTTTTFYIDGIKVGVAPNKSTESIAAIGGYQGGGQPFGRIDDVRIWNTALSQKNINDWMTRSVTASHPNWANMVAYYQLNSNGTNTKNPGVYTGVPTGSTTAYVNSDFYNYVWSGPGGATFSNNNNTSETTVISNPATGTYNVYATANSCNSTTIGTAITAVANPVAPTATKSPNVASVCVGQTLTLTGVTDNGGGIGCQIQYSVNGGAYSATLPSFAATVGTNTIAIKKTNCTAGLGCNESSVNTYSWTVVVDPAAPTATKSPNVASVCVGQTLTLTGVTDNGGGVGCQIQYSVNGGAYSTTLPSFAATVGTNTIAIKKTNCTAGLDCSESSVNTYSWTVVADPAAPTATKSPNVASVCAGQTLTLTGVTDNGGGVGCQIQYSVNGGAYSTTLPSFAATVGTNTIAIKKTNCTAGLDCNESSVNTYSWTVVADPSAPTATKSPNVASVCAGQTLTLTGVTDNGGGVGCQIQYSVNGGAYSTTLPSFAATVGTNTIAIKKTNCTAGLDCNESSVNTYSWTVTADPAAPTATKSPNVASVCAGQTLTLTGVTDNGGGVGCEIQYSVNGGAYSTTLPSFAATVGTNTIAIKKANCTGGLGCDESSVNTYSWTVVADPAAPTATKSPNAAAVCEGQTLTLTGVTDNGGGVGCQIQYSVNGGAYSTTLPSFAATVGTNTIAIKKTNCTAGLDCNESTVNTYSWTVVADPTIAASSATTICSGGSASLSSSAGGGTGTCGYQWQIATAAIGGPFTDISGATGSGYNTTALTATTWYRVIRSCDGNNCNTATSNVIEVTVAPAPVAGTITKVPDVAGVCQSTNVSATITAGSGGGGVVTDVSEYSTNGGANWNPYVSGTSINTASLNGNNVVQIRTRRESTGSNCSPSAWTTVFWTVDNAHTAATITNANPSTVCAGGLVTLSTNANAGTNGSINWYTGPGGTGTFVGNSSITTANPTANTTYYAFVSGSACPNLESSVGVTANTTSNVSLPGTGTYSNLQEQCTIAGWTYYALAGSPNQWIFAIRKNVQSVTPTFDVDLASHTGVISSVSPAIPSHGSYLMRRYWNVSLVSGSIANGIDIRFYYDPADMAAAVAMRDADFITYSGISKGPSPQWFKTNAASGGFHPSLLTPGMGNNWTFPFTFFGPGSSTGQENGVNYVQFDGLTSLSGGTGGTTFGESFPLLPVELVSLTANANESSISVNWVTASEINNEKFVVLRSTDAVSFTEIGEVAGNGTTNATSSYSFEDMDVEENVIYYYKLMQVDFDGVVDYSQVVSAVINTEGKFMIGDLIPNPANDYSYVEIISPIRGNINFLITNVVGQEMMSGSFIMEEGSQRLYFDIDKLLPGNYIITIITDTGMKEARKLQIIR
jgi:hypothetical protein